MTGKALIKDNFKYLFALTFLKSVLINNACPPYGKSVLSVFNQLKNYANTTKKRNLHPLGNP